MVYYYIFVEELNITILLQLMRSLQFQSLTTPLDLQNGAL
jgi:hypothetical protein